MRWQTTDFPDGEGTLRVAFIARGDGELCRAVPDASPAPADSTGSVNTTDTAGTNAFLSIGIRDGHALVEARGMAPDPHDPNAPRDAVLDMEDAFNLSPGTAHELTLTFGRFGTRVHLDGYQCFASAGDLAPTRLGPSGRFILAEEATLATRPEPLRAEEIARTAPAVEPDVVFAGPALAPRDVRRIAHLREGAIAAQFRVRGRGQNGVILAAGIGDDQRMTVRIEPDGIALTMRDDDGPTTYRAPGDWDDGDWHHLAVRACRGAVELFMDGVSVLHQSGQMWFADLARGAAATATVPDSSPAPIDRLTVGCDLRGVRLMGEVRQGGVLFQAPTDGQIARLAHAAPLVTTALFDAGYAGSASYRIPSLVRTPRGTLIAGADRRTAISNDAPNHIDFVIRRSTDGGRTWLPMQTVIAMPGREDGLEGASAIDSCPVADARTGRVTVLIDLNPGGIGLTNCERGLGVDAHGDLKLWDADGNETTLSRVPDAGDVWRSPRRAPAGQRWHAARTCYVAEIHSDDDGATWSEPRLIDHMVKEPWMRFMGVCPGAGIQLTRGAHAGRLLVPFYCSGDSRVHYSNGALISDDGGETWRRGRMVNEGRTINGRTVDPVTMRDDDATGSETVFVQRADGDVVAFFRNQNASGRVGKAVSHDGGETWDGLEFDPALPEIFSQPNAIAAPGLGDDAVLFANASQMLPYRGRGVVRLSVDGARTWSRSLCVHPHHHVYQCMAACDDSTLGMLWEIETSGVYITYIPFAWLSGGHGEGARVAERKHHQGKESS
ncbi:Glycosyl hydrolase, BNR repeat-containing protein [Bifidobacterium sp. DSM 109958]|uniref:exo-alpha-sialidase n=1 Tax=Bifidobacterium moraviense TaxID=2675323 RepID=A0A7Y0F212_9BIFI|nr:sialidase family protein [Bifidobacterium sp. DSM 109958]NMN00597.1 Glycosyl hydrolase, BNR repeat-containing protein [Bifidobacterium sp. DSM 109958]